MTDLAEFGGEVQRDKGDTEPADADTSAGRSYPRGRCEAVKIGGERCAGQLAVSHDRLCHHHAREADGPGVGPVTIHDDAGELVKIHTGGVWSTLDEDVRKQIAPVSDEYGDRDQQEDE